MARFVRGEVVVVAFPFSDLSSSKRRPALILAVLDGQDVILAQITSRYRRVRYSIPLETSDLTGKTLNQPSMVRPNRIFTADSRIIIRSVGYLSSGKMKEVTAMVVDIVS